MKPLLEALHRKPLDVPPVWVMRQAGRYLPEYREIRREVGFQEAVSDPAIAARITVQPVERFGMDAAIIFADIMTPLEAMGVEMTFDPGPRLRPHTVEEVARLPLLDPERVGFVAETIRRVREAVPDGCTVIGFAGAPVTLLAYLLEGGGSKEFLRLRTALLQPGAEEALHVVARSMHAYLQMQVDAGAEAVQLFDSWAGVLDRDRFARFAAPFAASALEGLEVPRIYFAPGAAHTLDLQRRVGTEAIGVDWRLPLEEAWELAGDVAIQGNLDPAVLLTDPPTIRREVKDLLGRVGGRPGHVVNLGHGIDRHTPPDHVAALVSAVRER